MSKRILELGFMLASGAAAGFLAAGFVTVREAAALSIGYALCAVGVAIRDQFPI